MVAAVTTPDEEARKAEVEAECRRIADEIIDEILKEQRLDQGKD